MRTIHMTVSTACLALALNACEPVDGPRADNGGTSPVVRLDDVAYLLSEMPIGREQLGEVYDAVSGSADNGYDEEYMMQDLFREPGSGVGDNASGRRTMSAPRTKAPATYQTPMRDLFVAAVNGHAATKGARDILCGATPEAYLDALQDSGIQIYWPYAESWNWEDQPVITFDPEDGSEANIGYEVVVGEDGSRTTREIIVTEELAMVRPVWVVNRNDDSDFTSLELLRKNDPSWGEGGNIIVTPHGPDTKAKTDADSSDGRLLLLKNVMLKRNLDAWFAGGSELVFRIGSVENFKASTEAELRLYTPQITDFVVVMKRREINYRKSYNAVLVSRWTPQLENCAFMVTEDDGGTRTSWTCSATVKVQSKSYGFDISIPINTRDDIVWRGQLSYTYINAYNGKVGHFGDIDIVFEVLDY